MAEMTNIEIRDFQTVSGAGENDFVVLSLSGGSSAKMAVGMFTASVSSNATPSIKEGVWWIGSVNTEVAAEGKTPELRRGELGVEYKYTADGDDAWKLLVPYEDIRINFDDLTDTQRDQIRLKYTDLSAEEIAELQRPANDMISALEETNTGVQAAEDTRAEEFARLKAESEAATDDARDTADHPTYIGADNYVYEWNKATKAYDKTAVYVRGEAFSIKKVYASVAEMDADTSASFKEGDFCLINTGDVEDPDNAQLYVRSASGNWTFLVDMSGAVGFTGKTPQMFVGTVTVGSGKSSAAVTLSSTGTDSDGNPEYNINYVIPCLAYEDLTAEQIADLQRPASDMIAQLQTTNDSVKANEADRVSAETARASAESARDTAEKTRESNEDTRKTAEAERVSAESDRAAAESARVTAESDRTSAETARASAESDRDAAEKTRVSNENVRKSNEAERVSAESDRAAAESARVTAESDRTSAETARASAESDRDAAEKTRVSNENARKANETERVSAESARASAESVREEAARARTADYATLRQDIVTATDNANGAASEARNIPKIQDGTWWVWDVASGEYKDSGTSASGRSPMIQNGTWWTWDDSLGKYVDSGQSVSSEYILSKEKIEGVFTGDIDTHTHTHLIYHAQTYEERPDFSTLTGWTGEDGTEHEFVPGNDIYVADSDEPTGYANYKYARTSSGNAWVLIPQVPEGFRAVLVKKEQ